MQPGSTQRSHVRIPLTLEEERTRTPPVFVFHEGHHRLTSERGIRSGRGLGLGVTRSRGWHTVEVLIRVNRGRLPLRDGGAASRLSSSQLSQRLRVQCVPDPRGTLRAVVERSTRRWDGP